MKHDYWNHADKGEVFERVFGLCERLHTDQSVLRRSWPFWAKLYSNRDEPGLHYGDRAQFRGPDKITENIVASVVNAGHALIGKSRVKVKFLTSGSGWDNIQQAKTLQRNLWGQFQALDVNKYHSELLRDSEVFGTGCLRVYPDFSKGKVAIERVLIPQIYINEDELPTGGDPFHVHRVRLIHREVLRSMYPKKDEIIDKAGLGFHHEGSYRLGEADMVMCIESHHKKLGKVKGRWTVTVDSGDLYDTAWNHEWLPYNFFHWQKPLTGFYGQGLPEFLVGYQVRVNRLNDRIQKGIDRVVAPRVWIEQGSRVSANTINNKEGSIHYYVGQPPIFSTPTAFGPEIYQYKAQVKRSAFEDTGISEMAARATRPMGIEAAAALRELSDNQSQRLSDQQQRYEGSFVKTGELILRSSKQLADAGKVPKPFKDEMYQEDVDWEAVNYDDFGFVITVSPASVLGDTPAGRIQRLIELLQYGVPIPPDTILRLLEHPDLEAEFDATTSMQEHVDYLDQQVRKGILPDWPVFLEPELAMPKLMARWAEASRVGAPPEVIEAYVSLIKQGELELEKKEVAAQEQQAAAAAQAGMPPGAEAGMPAEGPPQLPGGAIANTALPGAVLGN